MNKKKAGDRSTHDQPKGWGQKHIQTNKKGVGTEAHTNETNKLGQKHMVTYERTDALNPCSFIAIDESD